MPVAKEQIRQIISENNITSVADVYSLFWDSFKDILQKLIEAEIDVPRDRNGEFEPKLVPKYRKDISGIKEKEISLYARGWVHGISMSNSMISTAWSFLRR